MSGGSEEKQPGSSSLVHDTFSGVAQDTLGSGKRTLTEQLPGEPVQRKAGADGSRDLSFDRYEDRSFNRYVDRSLEPTSIQRKAASSALDPGDPVHAAAEHGISGSSSPLPHADEIQRSFGRHDVAGIKAHTDGAAAAGAAAMGAQAFASGNHVAFAGTPDLHTVAHEAAHVIQQRRGVQLKGGVGEVGDPYEQHADAVADAVVAGRSAEPLLDQHAGGSGGSGNNAVVQRAPAKHTPAAASHEPGPHIASATPGIDKTGFIDNGSGALLYNRPPEAGGELVRAAPLPPTARVFVSGTYPKLSDWWYVTAYLDQTMVRGYVERVRVAADLPEPLAELRQLTGGETAEGLAKEKYHEAVRDGHDLRYYENVLLYVNQQHHRKGVIGAYQDPGVAGNGSNNIQLVAGHRIWLVSPEYAKALESVVPSGSLTGGAVAKVKRFMGHLEDILKSVTESVHHVDEVAGEYAQAIRDHMASIIGITAGFITAEAISMFTAATPTGVGQAVAVVIQLALAAFGATGMAEAGIDATKHGSQWLTTAWTAKGDSAKILEASKEFLRMLVAIAVAALNHVGAKGNYRNALKIANSMPTGGLLVPATATASSGAQAGTGVAIGPNVGSIGATGAAAVRLTDKEKAALGEGPDVDGLRTKEIDKARSSERHDRRAADGRKTSTADELHPLPEARTEKAKHIPPPGEAFNEWFDSLTLEELDAFLADETLPRKRGAREIIGENIRHPGTYHEWLTVGEVRQFKKWGVSMKTIQDGRTLTATTIGKRFKHGARGSGTMHLELEAMIKSSNSYAEYLRNLNQWADRELVPSHSPRWPNEAPLGRYNLPENLQLREQ